MTRNLARSFGSHTILTWRGSLGPALALALACGLLAAEPAAARSARTRPASTGGYVSTETIQEVLARWRPETHLYVLGDVGLPSGALQELAAWIGDRHWTILLVQDASGQSFKDIEGITRHGEEAIEYGTGQGIPRQGGFAAQIEARTREADGAILTIVLAQRSLFYTGSLAQDSRSLGEDHFRDNLDRWAIQAMRSGGGLIAAVQETVANIDAQLEASISQEFQAAEGSLARAKAQLDLLERRARELGEASPGGLRGLSLPDFASMRAQVGSGRALREQGRAREAAHSLSAVLESASSALQSLDGLAGILEAGRLALQAAATAVQSLADSAAAFQKEYPDVRGPLARPDVESLRRKLAAAAASQRDDPTRVAGAAEAIRFRAEGLILAINVYPATGKSIVAAEARLAELSRRERASAAGTELREARQRLRETRGLYGQGALGYVEKLESAKGLLATAETEIAEADAAAASQRAAIFFLLLLALAALAALGFALNRRRRGVKQEAEQLLASWRTVLDRKLEVLLDELERRVARFVGPASGAGQLPHAGETLRLADQIRADVGSLYILWSSASGVLQQADTLIRAARLGALYNFFLPGRYRRGIALLKDEPVPFAPADGLPKLFGYERTWRDDLLGDLASYEPFRKSFQEIVAELNLRAGQATAALDTIETSVAGGPAELAEIEQRIRQTGARGQEIEFAGAADRLFLLPALSAAALPAAAAALDRARQLLPSDPVGALRGEAATAGLIAAEAGQLAELFSTARQKLLPDMEGRAAALRQVSIATGWLEAQRLALSQRADRLAQKATETTVAAEIERLASELVDLGSRAERAVALSRVLEETAHPGIRRMEGLVQAARAELGGALGLPAEELLREEESDPSQRLEAALQQAAAARTALGRGELSPAESALGEASRLTAEAESIVEATRQAFAAQAGTVEQQRAETARIEGLLPDHERILASIRETFAASVLALRAGDPAHAESDGTLANNLDEARAHLGQAHEKLARSTAAFPRARLLAAADLLNEVARHQALAVHRLEEIAERRSRLERTAESNRSLLETLESRMREYDSSIGGDPRTMRPTLVALEASRRQVSQARSLVDTRPGDPFLTEEALLAGQTALDDIHGVRAPSDRIVHAEAQRSVEAAAGQLAAADELAQRAAGDGIADSPEIDRALQELNALSAAQAEARETLAAPHGNWLAVDPEADRIAADASRCAATLTGELAAAEQAVAAIAEASRQVGEACSWRGAYGVTILGSPGAGSLARARSLLGQGRYHAAGEEAGTAAGEAARAIADAELAVQLRRAEAEREQEERRRAEHHSWESSSSSASSGSSSSGGSDSESSSSGSSSSSWGSSDSGARSSSWGSSDSGSGKSGW